MRNEITRYLIVFTYFLIQSFNSFSQAPEIEWENTIGGNHDDNGFDGLLSTDGGYIMAGSSKSGISGDKHEACYGGYDYWVVKLDSLGNTSWDNTIGGHKEDFFISMDNTLDDGYILIGSSESDAGFDKSEPSFGKNDFWIVKLNSSGNVEWDKTIGGAQEDYGRDIKQTNDGGFIVAGYSRSGISGNKTITSNGLDDYWILKLNATGDILWQTTFGGSSYDLCTSIAIASDGGYIAGGHSISGISGDKTSLGNGGYDYWIVRLDSSGNKIWDQTIGGSGDDYLNRVFETPDAGYFISGASFSDLSGDKTEPLSGPDDIWVVKINNSKIIEWQRTLGGSDDESGNGYLAKDGGYLICSMCESGATGVKTSIGNGGHDVWILKLNEAGDIEWQTDIGCEGHDAARRIIETDDGGYFIPAVSTSDICENKSEPRMGIIGEGDYWLVKLSPECFANPEICNTLDDNCNGLIDDGVVESISISAGGATTFCQGNTVLLSATYSGASVQWKKNGSNIPGAITSTYSVNKSGNYTAVTTSPCGTATSSIINVTVNKNPNASISAGGATTFCAGGSVTLTEIPVAGCTYQWYKGASLIAGATSTNYIATTAGNYKCRVTKTATGCYKNSNAISVTVPCKEGEWSVVSGEMEFNIYPNPNNGVFEISVNNLAPASPFFEGGQRGMSIDVFNSLGQLIYSQQINSTDNNLTQTISLDNISSGIYFVRIGDGNNYAEQKLIIEK